jgi:hypothetical protein
LQRKFGKVLALPRSLNTPLILLWQKEPTVVYGQHFNLAIAALSNCPVT